MKQFVLLYLALLSSLSATSQNRAGDIDSLFSSWGIHHNPGGTVLISHKNQIVFSKAYGLANIPYHIPNTEETVFNIGSVSKQFTAMGIVLLQLDGKLSFDDDITVYLPELKNLGHQITIRHLLHHTSGLRSTPELFGLAGWRDGDAISNDDVYNYLAKQSSLNFEPGSEFMYSNSGYILLAKIIERVSKQDFKYWMQENIFQPFQMTSTFIEEDHSLIISKTANSYTEIGPSMYKSIENNDLTFGASNVYSTPTDILKWMKGYTEAPKDWEKAFTILETLDSLHSGEKNSYAFGVEIDDFMGNRRIQHTGAIAGFQSIMYSYPDENLEIIILSNFTSNQLSKIANEISRLFVQNISTPTMIERSIDPIILHSSILKKYEGTYWNDKNNYSRRIYLENDTLWYMRTNNNKTPLVPISESEFQMRVGKENLLLKFDLQSNKFSFMKDGKMTDEFEKYDDKPLATKELINYTGTFYSPELETSYTISLNEGILYGYHSRFGGFEIEVLKKDVTNWSGMAISKYKRNEKGNVIGFYITMSRIRNLWFEKK